MLVECIVRGVMMIVDFISEKKEDRGTAAHRSHPAPAPPLIIENPKVFPSNNSMTVSVRPGGTGKNVQKFLILLVQMKIFIEAESRGISGSIKLIPIPTFEK